METPTALASARALSRAYRMGPATVRALDGVDLDLRSGEFLAVVGMSGSGKSTLLHLLGGLDTPSSGALEVAGRDLTRLDPLGRALFRRSIVGFVFQGFHLIPSMTARENVEAALTFQGVYGESRRRLASEAMRRVGLEAREGHRPGQLSGGEQQRVAVARAVVHRPPLLLADEPTGNLDRRTAEGVLGLLAELHREGTTVVMVTHDEATAARYATRRIRMRDGRFEEEAG